MRLSGIVHDPCDSSGYFAAEIPFLGIHTQGTSLRDAKEMALDALAELLVDFTSDGKRPQIELLDNGKNEFALQVSEIKPVLALALQTLRADADITLAEFARRLGEKSRQGPAQYEQGRSEPSFSKFDKMLDALGYDYELTITKRNVTTGHNASTSVAETSLLAAPGSAPKAKASSKTKERKPPSRSTARQHA